MGQETLQRLVATVSRFVDERLRPIEAKVAEDDDIPGSIVVEMRTPGLFGLSIPDEASRSV